MSKLQNMNSALNSIKGKGRLDKLTEICQQVNALVEIEAHLGPDDCDVVREAADYVNKYRNSLLAWWVTCRLATGLRDVGVHFQTEDIKAMCDTLQKADFDLGQAIVSHLDSEQAIDSAYNLAHVMLRGDTESGMADIQNSTPDLPDMEECQHLCDALGRIITRYSKFV